MAEGKFFIINCPNEMVLGVKDSYCRPGQPVTMAPKDGGDRQLWYEDRVNNCIRNKIDDGFVLEVKSDGLIVNEYQPDEYNQHWRVAGERIEHVEDSNKALQLAGDADDDQTGCSADGDNEDQLLRPEYQKPLKCFIRNKKSGDVLDIPGNNAEEGTQLGTWQQKDTADENQLFYEDKYGHIRSCLNDFCFDTTSKAVKMQPYDASVPGRQWIKYMDRIALKTDIDTVLDVKTGFASKSGKMVPAKYKQKDADQHWTFEYLGN